MSEHKSKDGKLLGPKTAGEYLAWRRNRDKLIANPRRLKTCMLATVTQFEKPAG